MGDLDGYVSWEGLKFTKGFVIVFKKIAWEGVLLLEEIIFQLWLPIVASQLRF